MLASPPLSRQAHTLAGALPCCEQKTYLAAAGGPVPALPPMLGDSIKSQNSARMRSRRPSMLSSGRPLRSQNGLVA